MYPEEESAIFDIEMLTKSLEQEIPQYDEENDQWLVQIYIGSVMSILPSGKYYTPFACSNVEICQRCKKGSGMPCTSDDPCIYPNNGTGDIPKDYHCEACQDARWWEQAEKELDHIDACLISGEGDPTDLFVWKEVNAPKGE